MAPALQRASAGYSYQIGSTVVYIGPGARGTKAPAILAFTRLGDKNQTVVADFRSSSTAEKFRDAMIAGIEEGTAHKPVNLDELLAKRAAQQTDVLRDHGYSEDEIAKLSELLLPVDQLPAPKTREQFVREQFEAANAAGLVNLEVIDETRPPLASPIVAVGTDEVIS